MKKIFVIVNVKDNGIYGAFQSKYDADKMARKLNKEVGSDFYKVIPTPFFFYKD